MKVENIFYENIKCFAKNKRNDNKGSSRQNHFQQRAVGGNLFSSFHWKIVLPQKLKWQIFQGAGAVFPENAVPGCLHQGGTCSKVSCHFLSLKLNYVWMQYLFLYHRYYHYIARVLKFHKSHFQEKCHYCHGKVFFDYH